MCGQVISLCALALLEVLVEICSYVAAVFIIAISFIYLVYRTLEQFIYPSIERYPLTIGIALSFSANAV